MIKGNTNSYLTIDQITPFIKKCNNIIKDAGFLATLGSVGLEYSCKCGHLCRGD